MGSKEELGTRIKTMRLSRKMTQADLAKSIGQSPSSITMYETGRREPDFETLEAMADVFNVPMSFFVTDGLPTNVMPIKALRKQTVPLIGSVAAGQPIPAEESVEMYIDSPSGADYALRVQGDSMSPTYLDGDIVYIKMTPAVTEGTVAVVLVDDDACLKHVYYISNGLQLVSDNPSYPPMIVTWPEHDNIRVLGKVIGYTRMYK